MTLGKVSMGPLVVVFVGPVGLGILLPPVCVLFGVIVVDV